MKKWSYLLSGILIGALVATSGSAVAAQVKSLVGQKVTGEYRVVVNGKELQDKGAVISGKTNAPVRAISESIGADLKVDNKTKIITITTDDNATNSSSDSNSTDAQGGSKEELLSKKAILESEIERLNNNKIETESKLEKSNEGMERTVFEQALIIVNEKIKNHKEELGLINAELATIE